MTNVPLADGSEGGFAGLARIPHTSQWVAVGTTDDGDAKGALAARFDGTSWSVQDVPDSTGVELHDVLAFVADKHLGRRVSVGHGAR